MNDTDKMLLMPEFSIKTLSGMTAGIAGGRMDAETRRAARPLCSDAIAHILGYVGTQSAAAQVWACGVGRQGRTLFVIVPAADVRRVAQSHFASMVWDDESQNIAKGRKIGAYAPRVCAHGLATAMVAMSMCGIDTRRYITGAAECRYSSIPKGANGTRSDALERMVSRWVTTFDNVESARWIGRLNGGGYDYSARSGRVASAHYNADIVARGDAGGAITLEVKGFCGRMICPQNARERFGL